MEGGLDRNSKELIFLNDMWDIVNQRIDKSTGKQASKVEVSVIIEILATVLNPLITLESQAYAVKELRQAIAASYQER